MAAPAAPREFSVPAGDAADTLAIFLAQAGQYVSFDGPTVAHHRTNAVYGDLKFEKALSLLLKGSGLYARIKTDTGTIMIDVAPSVTEHDSQSKKDKRTTEETPSRATESVVVQARPPKESASLLPDQTTTSVQYNFEDIERAGQPTFLGLLQSLPIDFGGGVTEGSLFGREAETNPGYGSGLNLHGVGSRATLVLVNGRRLAPSGSAGSFSDISNIPTIATKLVEVRSGGTTIMGGDAIGGTVNFVLLDETMPPVSVMRLNRFGDNSTGERFFGQSLRTTWDCGGGVFAAELYRHDAFFSAERARSSSDLSPWGGTNLGDIAGNPATLMDSNQTEWMIPKGQDGTRLASTQLQPGVNLHDHSQGATILPLQQRISLMARAHTGCHDSTTLWGEIFGTRRRVEAQSAGVTAALTIPTSNPWYVSPTPGPVQALYGFGSDLGPQTLRGTIYSGQATIGATHVLPRNWVWESFASVATELQTDEFGNQVNFDSLDRSLADSNPETAFNPFGDGSHTNPATLTTIRTQREAHYDSRLLTFSSKVSGPLLSLPAGDFSLAVGTEWQLQTFSGYTLGLVTQPGTDSSFDSRRTMNALYVDGHIPLLQFQSTSGAHEGLGLSGSLRGEHYSDVGWALAPQAGLTLRPLANVELGLSWSRHFRAPNLPDLTEIGNISTLEVLHDSSSSTGLTETLVLLGGNRSLKPESAEDYMAHIKFSSRSEKSFTIDYFRIRFSQIIERFDLSPTTLNDPQYTWLINRNLDDTLRKSVCGHSQFIGLASDCLNTPVGAFTDLRMHNAATLSTDGFDVDGDAPFETTIGRFRVHLTSTYVLHYEQATTPTSPAASLLNHAHYPIALRGRATLAWERRGFQVATTINYQGGYKDTDSVPGRRVSPWTTGDVVASYQLPAPSFFGGTTWTIGVHALNVLNSAPPFLNNIVEQVAYDQENANLLGRRIGVEARMSW